MAKIATAKAIYSSEPSKSVKIKSAEKVVFTPDSDAVQNQQANVLKEQLQNRFKSNVSEVIHPTFKGIKEQMKILENKTTIPSVSYDAEYAKELQLKKEADEAKSEWEKWKKSDYPILAKGLDYLGSPEVAKLKSDYKQKEEAYLKQKSIATESKIQKEYGITGDEYIQQLKEKKNNAKSDGEKDFYKKQLKSIRTDLYGKSNVFKHVGNIVKEGAAQVNKGVMASLDFLLGQPLNLLGFENNFFNQANQLSEDLLQTANEETYKSGQYLGDTKNVSQQAGVALIAAVPDLLITALTGGGSKTVQIGSKLANPSAIDKVLDIVKETVKSPIFYSSFIQQLGVNYEENVESGASKGNASLAALLASAITARMEMGGFQGLPDELADTKGFWKKAYKWALSAIEEGLEEPGQTSVTNLINKIVYDKDKKLVSTTDDKAVFNVGRAAKEFAIGTFVGGVLGGTQISINEIVNAKTNNQYKSIGEIVKKSLDVNEIVNYAKSSKNAQIRTIAREVNANTVSDSDIGRIYQSVVSNINEEIDDVYTEKDLEELAIKYSKENLPQSIKSILGSALSNKLIEMNIEPESNDLYNTLTAPSEPEISTENQPLQVEEQVQETTAPESQGEEITEQIGFREPTDQDIYREPTVEEENEGGVGLADGEIADFGGIDTSKGKHLDKAQQDEITDIGKKLGRKVVYEDFYSLDKFKGKKKIPDGYIDKDGNVHINYYAKRPVYFLFKHEITHYLKRSLASYNDFMNLVIDSNAFKDLLNKKGYSSIDTLKTEIMDTYSEVEGFDESRCYDEILANFVGEYLFGGENAINQNLIDALEPKQKKTFMDVIKGIIDYLKSKFQKNKPIQTEIDKIENEFIKVYKEAVGVRTDEAVDIEEQYAIYNHRGNLVEVDWDSDNFSSLSQQLQNHLEEVNNMQPVDSISFKATTGKKLYPQVFEAFKKFGFKVDVQNFGTIQLGEEEIRLAINGYINNDAEAAALLSIPRVLKRGKIISGHQNHKNRNYPTITFAAPVELNGKVGNVVVAVKVTGKTRYNAHRVLMPDGTEFVLDKEKDTESQLASVTDENEGQRFAKDSVSNNKLTQDKPIVKNNISKDGDFYSIPSTTSAESLLERYENGDITRQEYLDMLKGKKTLNPVEIANLKEEDANTAPPLQRKKGEAKGDKQSKFYGSIQGSELFGEEFKQEAASDEFIEKYKSITNKETLQTAAKELEEGGKEYVEKWWAIKPERANLIDTTVGFILMDRYQRAGKIEQAIAVAEKVREFGTASGQQVQIFSIIGRFDPDMMVAYAKKELSQAFETMVKGKTNKWIDKNKDKFQLTKEDIEFIRRRTLQAAMFEDGARQKAVALAEIQKTLQDKIPPESGDSIRALQRISMLLNPKTNERNIIGNAGMVGVFVASDVFGSGIDKIISQKTGVRTTGNFDIKSVSGIKKGLYESYDDFKRGIRTKQEELNRFDINASRSSKNFNENGGGIFGTKVLKKQLNDVAKVLNKIDNFTSFCLEAGDRPFFEMWYMNSLNTQLKLNNLEIPTPEMLEIAKEEALKRTWQDDNVYTRAVSNLKKNVNIIHIPGTSYGLGDFIFKFVKTPTNLAKAIVEFSPLGFAGATSNAIKLKNAIETNQFNAQLQKEFVRSTSNAITGTLVYALVAIGAALGVVKLSGDGDEDKDVSNYEKYIMGIPPYSIEFLGANMTYDWMQPFGSVLATVADFMQTKKEEPDLKTSAVIWEAIKAGGKTFTKQSFLQSMYDFFSQDDIVEGISSLVLSEPAAFIPQAFSQLASYLDKYRRTTYDATNAFQTSINKMIAKIPGLRTKLPKQVNVLGEDVKNTQYLNPWEAFASPWNTYPKSSNEIVGEIYDLYKKTGEDSVMPRTAPNYLTVKGNKVTFSPEEKAEFQRDMGRSSAEMLAILFDDSEYKKLSDNEKADVVSKIYEFAYAKSKSAIKYDYETLSAMAGEKKNGDPVLSESDYKKLPEKARQIIAQEYFLSKAEVRYIDNYNMLIQSFIKKVKE